MSETIPFQKQPNNDSNKQTNDNLESIGVTSSPSSTTIISIDITATKQNSQPSLLGKMVCLKLTEEKKEVLALGQITSIETRNTWHENMTFKGIIKQKGHLPNLSGKADIRSANLSIQSCFSKQKNSKIPLGHVLGISPPTGQPIKKMNDTFMKKLVQGYGEAIQYIGTVYGSGNINMPMWFRHFGKPEREEDHTGVGDALHIGVFGKTGSGKTVMSSLMLLSYAKTKKMNVLVFDPQGQFYKDKDLLPDGQKLKEAVEKIEGIQYKKYKLAQEDLSEEEKQISLPNNDFELFANLLLERGYIREAF